MKRLLLVAAVTSLLLTMASISWATSNLNLSKSNINRVQVVHSPEMTSTQAAALVAEFERTLREVALGGPDTATRAKVDEAAVRKALQKLFIPTNFKLISIIPGKPGKPITVLLLTNPADLAQARRMAGNDPGMPAGKHLTPSIPPASSK